jgi:hypothetical protein
MSNRTLTADETSFYSIFEKKFLSSYEFFRMFFAKLAKCGVVVIDSTKLSEFLQKTKSEGKYEDLLYDVNFSYNGISHYSRDIEYNIDTLQTLGALGRANPRGLYILNYFSSKSSNEILESNKDYSTQLHELAREFQMFSGE